MRIAHLTDLHLNGSADRRERFARALEQARAHRADRLVVTGDLTVRGDERHFDEVGGELVRAGWSPSRVHVVFGNHDGVAARARSQGTRLRDYVGAASYVGPGVVIEPIDTVYPRRAPIFSAMGRLRPDDVVRIERHCRPASRCVIGAMHHGPQGHPLEAVEGLVGRDAMLRALAAHDNLHILCGHDHRAIDRGRVHVAGSVAHHPDPLRIYEVVGPRLVPVYKSEATGSWLSGMVPW